MHQEPVFTDEQIATAQEEMTAWAEEMKQARNDTHLGDPDRRGYGPIRPRRESSLSGGNKKRFNADRRSARKAMAKKSRRNNRK